MLKIAPEYSGTVVYVKDASQNAYIATALINGDADFVKKIKQHQQDVREANNAKQVVQAAVTATETNNNTPLIDWNNEIIDQPNSIELQHFSNIDINLLTPYINWKMLLIAWKVSGDFSGIEEVDNTDDGEKWLSGYEGPLKQKAEEAVRIIIDAKRILRNMVEQHLTTVNAVVQIVPAASMPDDTVALFSDEQHTTEIAQIRFRRQKKADENGHRLSLTDYVAPQQYHDHIGMFVGTAGIGLKQHTDQLMADGNDYEAIMMKLLADRLVEALSEWLHQKVRTEIWGYDPTENQTPLQLIRGNYRGVRPEIGRAHV